MLWGGSFEVMSSFNQSFNHLSLKLLGFSWGRAGHEKGNPIALHDPKDCH